MALPGLNEPASVTTSAMMGPTTVTISHQGKKRITPPRKAGHQPTSLGTIHHEDHS